MHSNGLLAEMGAWLAARAGKPFVLTLYGTEIWHYQPKRHGLDLFTRAYRAASAVTFYSDRLLLRARELGLGRPECHVIYPPVSPAFALSRGRARSSTVRQSLGLTQRHVLINVKRLHPLAGQRFLIEAMGEVVREFPDTRLVICGTGELLGDLQAAARSAGVERHVTFAGLVDNASVARYCGAADLFVLPSLLEALPTVAVEALASGTPVVSADNPGGLELAESLRRRCRGGTSRTDSIRWLRPSRTGSGTSDGRCRPRARSSRGSSVRPRSLNATGPSTRMRCDRPRRPSALASKV